MHMAKWFVCVYIYVCNVYLSTVYMALFSLHSHYDSFAGIAAVAFLGGQNTMFCRTLSSCVKYPLPLTSRATCGLGSWLASFALGATNGTHCTWFYVRLPPCFRLLEWVCLNSNWNRLDWKITVLLLADDMWHGEQSGLFEVDNSTTWWKRSITIWLPAQGA